MKKIFPILFLPLFLFSHQLSAQNKLVGDWVIKKRYIHLPPPKIFHPEPNMNYDCSMWFIGFCFNDSMYEQTFYSSEINEGEDLKSAKQFYEITKTKNEKEIVVRAFTYTKSRKKIYTPIKFEITFINDDVLTIKYYDGSGSVKRYRLYRKKP